MDGAPGLVITALEAPLLLSGCVNTSSQDLATFFITFFVTTSDDDLNGLLDTPTPREFGGIISAYVISDEAMLSMGIPGCKLVLSDADASTNPVTSRVLDIYNTAMTGRARVFTHLQQRSTLAAPSVGSSKAIGEWAVVADVHENSVSSQSHLPVIGDDVDSQLLSYESDGESMLDSRRRRVSFSVPSGSRMLSDSPPQTSDITLTREEVESLLLPRLGNVGQRYAALFVDAVYPHRVVLRPMRGGSSTCQIRPRVLPGTPVCRDGLRRVPRRELLPKVWAETDRLLGKHIIEELPVDDPNQWLLPLVVAVRPTGAIRMCLDAKKPNLSNASTLATVLPGTQDHIDLVANSHITSCLDKPDAFHQISVDDEGRKLFGYALPDQDTGRWRYFRFTCAIFGFTLCPGWFQDFIQEVLVDIPHIDALTRVPMFIDNVDVATLASGGIPATQAVPVGSDLERDMVERHVKVLSAILAAYAAAGLTIKLEKCTFGATEISTMGVIAGSGHYRTDPAKLQGYDILCARPERISLKWLRAVLGTLNYLRRMLGTEYTRLADPLFTLLRDALAVAKASTSSKTAAQRSADSYLHSTWDEGHSESLRALVQRLRDNISIAVLRHDAPVYLRMDASDAGVGGAAGQYGSDGLMYLCIVDGHRFSPLQRLWSVGAREIFGWLLFMRRWWRHLVGFEVVFGGDHLNLLQVDDLENTTVRRWLVELSSFSPWMAQFRNTGWTARYHIPGVCIALCDFLSRNAPPDSWLPPPLLGEPVPEVRVRRTATAPTADDSAARASNPHVSVLPPFVQRVLDEQAKWKQDERQRFIDKHKATERRTALGSLLFVRQRLAVPPTATELIKYVFTQTHDRFGHPDVERTLQLISDAKIFIPDARKRLQDWYDACSCQLARAPLSPQRAGPFLLAPTSLPLEHVYADFASLVDATDSGGTAVKGLLVQVDKASRLVLLTVVPTFSADTVIMSYRRWRSLFGTPSIYSTDGGRHFANAAVQKVLDGDGVTVDVGTPYHSRGRGTVERNVGRTKQLFRRVLPPGQPGLWPAIIDEIQFLLNSLPNRALGGRSAFEYLYGVAPRRRLHAELFAKPTSPQSIEDRHMLLSALRWVCDACSGAIAYLRAADSATRLSDISFDVGDTIALFYPEREHALAEGYYRGPYIITAVDGDFYTVREILANGAYGKPVNTHVSRMLAYNMSRASDVRLHQAKLPDGYYVVKNIVGGPRDDGRFQVEWYHTAELTWEPPSALWSCDQYATYCEAHELELTGVPKRPKEPENPSGRPRRAARSGH